MFDIAGQRRLSGNNGALAGRWECFSFSVTSR
jgi:hypothetical protein